jgi:hypothetical protein
MKICAPETYIRLNNRGKGTRQLRLGLHRQTDRQTDRSKEFTTQEMLSIRCQTIARACISQQGEYIYLLCNAMQCNATCFRLASTGASTPQQFYSTRKKKAAAAIVSGTYLIVHNVKRTRSKVQESAKTRKTQSPKHTHTHTHKRTKGLFLQCFQKHC